MNYKRRIMLIAAMLLPGGAATSGSVPVAPSLASVPSESRPTISVLTYNVKGLPWPIASGRTEALDAIAVRLRSLRAASRNPHIVVLQEAFTAEARAIGRSAGYRYVVDGPDAELRSPVPLSPADRQFAAGARWWKGETEGKWVGSGLQILSDYPVLGVRRVAYPGFACAGYDCLANKGALLVSVAVPGLPTPVDIVTTHLNSRHSSGVPDARSIYAYQRQVGILSVFIRRSRDPRHPLIVAGDFNVGAALPRRAALMKDVRSGWSSDGMRDALTEARRAQQLVPDAAFALRRARDWEFFAPGGAAQLILTGLRVPFGHEPTGGMLSDHVGYVALFRAVPKVPLARLTITGITRSVEPKA